MFRWGMSMWQTCLTLVRVLFLPNSVYEGIAKAGTGLLLFFSTLFGVFSLAAIVQNNLQWYPDLIDFEHTQRSFLIDHAKVSYHFVGTSTQRIPCASPHLGDGDLDINRGADEATEHLPCRTVLFVERVLLRADEPAVSCPEVRVL